jgi:NAD(P)-dependent dehydrogenase (short-subunit alcohol dehydrogenase family)
MRLLVGLTMDWAISRRRRYRTMSENWDTQNIPDLAGKVMVVTGANHGLGLETTRALARHGATVVMACRNPEKANAAAQAVRQEVARAQLDLLPLDLADLASVHGFAELFLAKYATLDVLINNAGIMLPPFGKTKDGFELQFGTNHLGHFVLTGLLLSRLRSTRGARIVSLSSGAHRMGSGAIQFDNLNAERKYDPFEAYAQSKLANLLFILHLNRQLEASGATTIAAAAHPGWALTGLQKGFMHTASRLFGQSAAMGALPALRAATAPEVVRNDYWGPGNLMELRGYPRRAVRSRAAQDAVLAERLWQVSEDLTGLRYAWSS